MHTRTHLQEARIEEAFKAMDSMNWEAKKMTKMMKGLGMGAQVEILKSQIYSPFLRKL